jgi:DNA-binding response OmpR family regulator
MIEQTRKELQFLEELLLSKGRVVVRVQLHTRSRNKRADYNPA